MAADDSDAVGLASAEVDGELEETYPVDGDSDVDSVRDIDRVLVGVFVDDGAMLRLTFTADMMDGFPEPYLLVVAAA